MNRKHECTVGKAAEIIGITRPTLWRWERRYDLAVRSEGSRRLITFDAIAKLLLRHPIKIKGASYGQAH